MEEGSTSKFNEAALKMRRIDSIQSELHNYRIHLLRFDPMYQMYHYEIVFSLCNSLEMELLGYLTKDEENKINEIREDLNLRLEKHKPHELKRDRDTKVIKLNKENWNYFKKKLFEYERELRKLIHIHKLGSPVEVDEEGWD